MDGHDVPREELPTLLEGTLCGHLQPAAAGDLHVHDRDRTDGVAAQNLGELLAVVDVVEFRTADQADTAGEEAAVKRRVGIGGAVRRDEQRRVLEVRRADGRELDLDGPVHKLALRVLRGGGGVSRAAEHLAHGRAGTSGVYGLLLRGLRGLDGGLVVGGGLALLGRLLFRL